MRWSSPLGRRSARLIPLGICTAVLLLGLAPHELPAQAAYGTVSVLVRDAAGTPLSQVQVAIVNTLLGSQTGEDGRATIRGVPPGPQTVRALRIGYAEQKGSVTVAAGGVATIELTLQTVAVNLSAVVSTATGQARRVEVGNAIPTIDAAAETRLKPISNMQDLLNGRAPGVQLSTGTQAGTGARVRIRGAGSLNLSNDPIYVIDGVRMTSNNGSFAFFTGDAQPSRVVDINPEEIENIEIVKGPSAATLYGTDAANGVIVITTRRGRAGAPRWSVYSEVGRLEDNNRYPDNYTGWNGTTNSACRLPNVAAGTCTIDSVRTYSPINDPDATPIGRGSRSQTGLQLSGGTSALRYFMALENENEMGVFSLPKFERRYLDSVGVGNHYYTRRPNALDKQSFRLNLNAAVSPTLDVAVNTNYIRSTTRLSNSSNATAGIGSQAFGGPGYKNSGTVSGTGTPLNGYRAWTPAYSWQELYQQGVNRFIVGVNAQWRPFPWMQNRVNVGSDFTAREDNRLRLRGEAAPLTATYRLGAKENSRTGIQNFSVDLGSTANFQPLPWISSKTTVGVQYVHYAFDQNNAGGSELSAGSQQAGANALPSAFEASTISRTLGIFVEEAVALNDRLFVTFAVRSDQNSAFGTDFQSVLYPKASVSWLVSDEAWYRAPAWSDNLRLRMAFGASGVQPGPNDALRSYAAAQTNVAGTDQPGLIFNAIGNTDLRPERSTEFEAGFEAGFLQGRYNVDLTYYRKRTTDALISAIVAPSLGAATSVRRNLGATLNRGWELLLRGQLVDREWWAADLTISGHTNFNRLLDLGGTPPQIGTNSRVVEGFPMFGWWGRPITGWEDRNGDGLITYNATPALNEVFVGDSAVLLGYATPRYNMVYSPAVELLDRKLRISALIDRRDGNRYYNNTERIRCASRLNCRGLNDPTASFEEQAMVQAALYHPARTNAGFMQPGAFTRLREVSVSYQLPPVITNALRSRDATITFAARNVKKWSRYRGVDPENDFTVTDGGDLPNDFQTFGPASYYILRLNLGF
jgi:TonB-linked SusC/RagA family outer membrane protein